jgi:hypothetical protein
MLGCEYVRVRTARDAIIESWRGLGAMITDGSTALLVRLAMLLAFPMFFDTLLPGAPRIQINRPAAIRDSVCSAT